MKKINLKKAELISLKKSLQVSANYKKALHSKFNLKKAF